MWKKVEWNQNETFWPLTHTTYYPHGDGSLGAKYPIWMTLTFFSDKIGQKPVFKCVKLKYHKWFKVVIALKSDSINNLLRGASGHFTL